MSRVGRAIHNFKNTLAQSAPLATMRHAWRTFKSGFSNISIKPLASWGVKTSPKSKVASAPEETGRSEQDKNPDQVTVPEFIGNIVKYVEDKLHPNLRRSDQAFLVGVPKALMEMGLTGEKLARFLENTKDVQPEGRGKIVLDMMHASSPKTSAEWATWFKKPEDI